MDKHTIYVKTREGDEAVRQRTRLGRRVLRNILIMVDGHATVAELAKRFGDDASIEGALAELERGGLVEPVASQVGQEIAPAAHADIIAAPPEAEAQLEDIPVLTTRLAEPSPQAATPALAPMVEEIVIDAPEYYSLPPVGASEPVRTPERATAKVGSDWAAKLRGILAGLAARRAQRRRAGRREQEDGKKSAPAVSIKPVWRARRLPVSLRLLAAMAVAAAFLLLALVAVFFPYDRYLPDVEREASAALNEPVKVGHLGFSFLPQPNITLEGIEIGKEGDLAIGSVRVVPDVLSLFGERKVIRDLHLEAVAVKGQGLARLAQWGGVGGAVEIRHITVAALTLEVGDALFEGIKGEVKMAAGGVPEKILLRNADGSLRFEAWPNGSTYRVAVLGSAWKAPFKPGLVFDYLDAEGELGPSRLDLSRIEGKLYDGLIAGVGSADWSKSAVLAGEIELKRLNLAKLLPALDAGVVAEGELIGTVRLDAKADSLARLGDTLRASAAFDIGRGAIRGLDLVEAVRSAGRNPTRGGATRFERFSGNLQLDQQACRLTNLRVSSGLMKASGNVNLGPEKRLDGVMEVELKGTAALLRVPVTITGTTRAPLLMAGKR